MQVESLLGNIKHEHIALRKLVEAEVYGNQCTKKVVSAVRRTKVVTSSAPVRVLSGAGTAKVGKTILKGFARKQWRVSTGFNTFMSEKMRGCGMKAIHYGSGAGFCNFVWARGFSDYPSETLTRQKHIVFQMFGFLPISGFFDMRKLLPGTFQDFKFDILKSRYF